MKKMIKLLVLGCVASFSFSNASAQNAHLAEWSVEGTTLTAKFAGLGNQTWCITVGVTLEESILCEKTVELGNGGENIISNPKTRTGTAQFSRVRTERNGHHIATATINFQGGRVECPNDNSGFVEVEGSYSSTAVVSGFTATIGECQL